MMRTRAAFGIAAAAVLASTSAYASDTGKGETGGKGGLGPAPSTPAPSGVGEIVPLGNSSTNPNANADTSERKEEKQRPWTIGATFETHRMIRQDDLEGQAPDKVFNVFGVYGSYSLSEHDRVSLRAFLYERFIADEGESGIRTDDIAAVYTRTEQLPQNFVFSGSFALSAPTSFGSQKMGLITAPSLILSLNKRFGRYVGVNATISSAAFITKYREAEGGAANPEFSLRGSLEAEVTMPFHEPLSIGVSATTGYLWFYGVASGDPSITAPGVVSDNQFSRQPIQQSYGGEVFARYTMPQLAGMKSDLAIALAQGDPSLGYVNALHDGVGYTYLFFRQNSEVYASFSLRY